MAIAPCARQRTRKSKSRQGMTTTPSAFVTKQRDMVVETYFHSRLIGVSLGEDEDGDPVHVGSRGTYGRGRA